MKLFVTENYLKEHPDHVFVFGDNTLRKGTGGAAQLRYVLNTYGFITKKFPDNKDTSFYKPEEYLPIYTNEIEKLKNRIEQNPDLIYLISELGSGLANKYNIFEQIIKPRIKKDFKDYKNVIFLW